MKSIIDAGRLQEIALSHGETQRYARHLSVPDVGIDGQHRLKAARVLCIGSGGLGSPVAMYLAAAGVGKLGLVDFDVVDFSNLQRQILHGTSDVGKTKLESAKETLLEINPEIELELFPTAFTSENAREIAGPYDIIIDGCDNFATRYLSNDVSVLLKKPNIYGSIFRFEGQCSVFAPHLGGPCYRCMFPTPPSPGMVPSCAEGGVLGVLPGLVGMLQATEAIKLICGLGDSLMGRLLHIDALKMRFREFKLRPDPRCPLCSDEPTITELIDYEAFCGLTKKEESMHSIEQISVTEYASKPLPGSLLDVREPFERDLCTLKDTHHIPLGELPDRLAELPKGEKITVYCKSGGRSMKAAQLLQAAGFEDIINLEGGINAWSHEVDDSVALY